MCYCADIVDRKLLAAAGRALPSSPKRLDLPRICIGFPGRRHGDLDPRIFRAVSSSAAKARVGVDRDCWRRITMAAIRLSCTAMSQDRQDHPVGARARRGIACAVFKARLPPNKRAKIPPRGAASLVYDGWAHRAAWGFAFLVNLAPTPRRLIGGKTRDRQVAPVTGSRPRRFAKTRRRDKVARREQVADVRRRSTESSIRRSVLQVAYSAPAPSCAPQWSSPVENLAVLAAHPDGSLSARGNISGRTTGDLSLIETVKAGRRSVASAVPMAAADAAGNRNFISTLVGVSDFNGHRKIAPAWR
jgi:hypothetical protein